MIKKHSSWHPIHTIIITKVVKEARLPSALQSVLSNTASTSVISMLKLWPKVPTCVTEPWWPWHLKAEQWVLPLPLKVSQVAHLMRGRQITVKFNSESSNPDVTIYFGDSVWGSVLASVRRGCKKEPPHRPIWGLNESNTRKLQCKHMVSTSAIVNSFPARNRPARRWEAQL